MTPIILKLKIMKPTDAQHPRVCALLLVILWGIAGVEVVAGESCPSPRS